MVTTTSILFSSSSQIPESIKDLSIAMLKDMGETERADALRKTVEDSLAYLRPYGKYLVTRAYPAALVDGDSRGVSCFGVFNDLRCRVIAVDVVTDRKLIVDDQLQLAVIETAIECRFYRTKGYHEHVLLEASWESFPVGPIMVGLARITGEANVAKAKMAALMAKVDKFTQGAAELLLSA